MRSAALLAIALMALGCRETTLAVRVVAADGGDPFLPPDGATQARFAIEDMASPVSTANVASNGAFTLDVELGSGRQPARAVLEALVGSAVIGSGATPPINWVALGPAVVPIFVQRRDTVVESPWRLGTARTSPWLFELSQTFVVTFGGTSARAPVESFDELTLNPARGVEFDGPFNQDAAILQLRENRFLFVRGCAALIWNAANNTSDMPPMNQMPPSERCAVMGSSVVQEPGGGGLLVGGHDATGPVARVDQVQADGSWTSVVTLVTPRDHPAVTRLGPFEALVAGGQRGTTGTFLERYSPSLPMDQRLVRTGIARVDERTGAALVPITDGVVLALGGVVAGSTDLVPDDVVIDARCVGGGCPSAVLATRALLSERRRDPVAAVAEGERVVVASGAAAGGVAASVELIDVTRPRDPQGLGAVAALPYSGLSMIPLRTGSVLIAGGGRAETWFYRH